MTLQENKDAIFSAVRFAEQQSGRAEQSVNIIAVTKYVDSSIAKKLVKTGISHIGENRVDKFLDKYHSLADEPLTWHLIGSLQRRKVKEVIDFVDYFHALDSVKLATEIQKRASKPIKCFLQVNLSREESKHGFLLEEIEVALEEMISYDKVELVGLMTMAPLDASEKELENLFSETSALRKKLADRNLPHMPFTDLSMGMSGDFALAIANGATFVRIGTAFFKEENKEGNCGN